MPRERLQRLLAELRQELAEENVLDAESRAALRRLSDRIDQDAAGAGKTRDQDTASESPLAELNDATLRLESRHPRLAQLLGQIGDTLGKLGI